MSLTIVKRFDDKGQRLDPAEMSVSATGLVSYSVCARKFKWSREDNWEYDGPKKANAMCLGSLVHYLLEVGIPVMTRPGDGPMTALEVAKRGIDSWIAAYTDNEMVQTQIYTDIVPYATSMALNTFLWFEQEKFFDRYEIISMEKDYAINIDLGWELRCRPDLIVRDRVTQQLGIIDFKTGTSVDQAPMNSDWQMRAMAVVLENHYRSQGGNNLGDHSGVAFGGHLRIKKIKDRGRAKPPYVQLNEMRFDEERIELALTEIIHLMWQISDDVVHLPSPTWTCASMCSFYDACEAKSANQDWEYVMKVDHKKGTDDQSEKSKATA